MLFYQIIRSVYKELYADREMGRKAILGHSWLDYPSAKTGSAGFAISLADWNSKLDYILT